MIGKRNFLASLSAVVLLFAIAVGAQTTSTPSLQNDTGINPQETYDGVRENISLATGGLNISIPLVSLPGRNGLDFSVSMTYNSQFWVSQYIPNILYWTQESTSWQISRPGPIALSATTTVNPKPDNPDNITCWEGYVLLMGDGGKVSFPTLRTDCKWWDTKSLPNQPHWMSAPEYNVLTGGDNSGRGFYANLTTGILAMRDGATASFIPGGGAFNTLTDSNGNQITLGGLPSVDTLGRSISFDSTGVRYSDSNGSPRTVTINYQSFAVSCTFPTPANAPGLGVSEPFGTLRFPSSVVLPNGLTYTFQYNGCGQLTKITYPSGGYTRYVYDNQNYTHWIYPDSYYTGPVTYSEVIAKYVCRVPAVAFGATSTDPGPNCPVSEDATYYSPTIDGKSGMGSNSTMTVTDPLGNVTRYEFSQASSAPGTGPFETKRTIYQGASTVLRTIQTTYLPAYGYPTSKTTSLPNGLSTQTQWDYDGAFNVTEVREYAYGLGSPGPLVRRTHNTWGVYNRKTSEIIYDGANNKLSETDYELDNYTAGISASGAVQHNSSFGPSFTQRGNVTAVKRWRNTDGAMLITRNQYDDAGNVVSTTAPANTPYDSLVRTTTYSYADSWGNSSCLPTGGCAKAYVTQVTDPAGLVTKSSYNSCTGTRASYTDQNNQPTTYGYDLMDRRTLTTGPDQGQVSTCYSEVSSGTCYRASYPIAIGTTRKITPSLNKQPTTVMDGLARVVQTQLNSNPEGVTYVDTTYDGAEHEVTVSNPYRSPSDSTYGITTTVYDALDRVTMQIPPDGTSASNNETTNYDIASTGTTPPGNCSMVTDQAGRFRQSCSDALGRLIEVDEPTSTANGAPGAGTVVVSGTEQNPGPTHSQASIIVSGFELPPARYCPPQGGGYCYSIYDQGNYTLTIGTESYSFVYDQNSTINTLASSFASSVNYSSHLVTATASGGTVTLTSIGTGSTTNYTLSSTFSWNSQFFAAPSFSFNRPNWMSGGSANPPDAGTVSVTVGTFTAHANYSVNSTSHSVAIDLANDFNTNSLSPVTSSTPSGTSLNLTAKTVGTDTNYPLSFAAASSNSYPTPSFSASSYTSSLMGGAPSGGSLVSDYVTLYNYDVLNNLLCVEQHGNVSGTGCSAAPSSDASSSWRVRRFSYNSLGQLLTSSNPEISMPVAPGTFCSVGYTYDNVGNLYQKTSPKPNQSSCSISVTTSFTYDADNRLTQKSYNDGSTPTAKYGYDGVALSGCTTTPPSLTDTYPKGYRTAMCDGSGATSWKHDMMGRTLSESRKIGTISNSISYTYNLDSSTASLTYPSGRTITYAPGGAGRPLSAVDSTGSKNYVTGATYAPPGELAIYTYGASITNINTYNKRLQPISLLATGSTGLILSLTYDFHLGTGNNGNVYQITNGRDSNRSATFSYDSLNRITQAYSTGPNWGETFSTDAWSNLNGRSPANGKTNYEALSVAALNSNRLSGFGYDAAGNMTSNGSATYTYDAENRLLTTAGVTYAYDGDGNRVKKSSGTLYWGVTLAESDLTATASSWKEYIFFAGKRVARREAVDNKAHYYYSDHLGSTSVVTDEVGTMSRCTNSPTGYTTVPTGEEESDFYPYGGEMKLCDRKPQNYKFTGKERDTESGLDNFGARYDSSALGRFMTPDWAAAPTTVPYASFGDPQTLNLYSYVENSPINRADADGHAPWGYGGWDSCGNSDFCQKNMQEAAKEAFLENAGKLQAQSSSSCGFFCKAWNWATGNGWGPGAVSTSASPTETLINAQNAAMSSPSLQPGAHGAPSHCSEATCQIAHAVGANAAPLDGARANQQAANLAHAAATPGSGWHEIPLASAQQAQNQGQLVVYAWENPTGNSGHTVTGRPDPNNPRPATNPTVAQVGGSTGNGVMGFRNAFGANKRGEVRVYVYTGH